MRCVVCSWLMMCACLVSSALGQEGKAKPIVHRQRASLLDKSVAEHPEIDFVFTDSKGKEVDWEHAVPSAKGVTAQGKLVIWLMDYNAPLFERLSGYGLHSIQVHYANKWFGKLNAEADRDPNGLGNIRLEAATGEDFSPLVTIPKADSIMERTRHFLLWLDQTHPEENWKQFLSGDRESVLWDRVILSGISHGSTTAARFALHQKVARVVMFSGPRDNNQQWQTLPSATPKDRFFAFTHTLDMGWEKDHYPRSWKMLGLDEFGPYADVDKQAYPFGKSHQLITSADVGGNADRAHSGSVPGSAAIKDASGKYAHEQVWKYLFEAK